MKCKQPVVRCEAIVEAISKATEYDGKYYDATLRALRLVEPSTARATIKMLLSRARRHEFIATNPYAKQIWVDALVNEFHNLLVQKELVEPVYNLITLTTSNWAFPDCGIEFDLERAKKKVRNALSGMDYIGCFEAGVYTNETWTSYGKEGKLVSFHFHALIIASSQSKLDRIRKQIERRFTPILGKKSGVHLARRKTKVCALMSLIYIAKMPYYGYRTFLNDQGKMQQRKNSAISARTRWYVLRYFATLRTGETWIAGGRCASILSRARSRLRMIASSNLAMSSPRLREVPKRLRASAAALVP